jgi:hypothetical protein
MLDWIEAFENDSISYVVLYSGETQIAQSNTNVMFLVYYRSLSKTWATVFWPYINDNSFEFSYETNTLEEAKALAEEII